MNNYYFKHVILTFGAVKPFWVLETFNVYYYFLLSFIHTNVMISAKNNSIYTIVKYKNK